MGHTVVSQWQCNTVYCEKHEVDCLTYIYLHQVLDLLWINTNYLCFCMFFYVVVMLWDLSSGCFSLWFVVSCALCERLSPFMSLTANKLYSDLMHSKWLLLKSLASEVRFYTSMTAISLDQPSKPLPEMFVQTMSVTLFSNLKK